MSSRQGSPEPSSPNRDVLRLDEIESSHGAEVGAKCASLALVRRASAEGALGAVGVPDGFVITCSAAGRMFAAAGVRERLQTLMGQAHRGECTVHEAGHAARETVLALEVPEDLRRRIATALTRLEASGSDLPTAQPTGATGAKRGRWAAEDPMLLAVRSSAVAEDLPEASFAGQYDSHLGVHGLDQLLDAYRSVLASLFTDRVIEYRHHLDMGPPERLDLAMAVGVQRLVRADRGGTAGVLLTLDPDAAPEDPPRLVIEAVRGLGDALVGGSADPARYLVARHEDASDPRAPDMPGRAVGGRTAPTSPQDAEPVLDATQVQVLTRAGLVLERRAGHALDIEWAVDGRSGELFLLQARPLTGPRRTADTGPRPRTTGTLTSGTRPDQPDGPDGPDGGGDGATGAGLAHVLASGRGIGSGEVTAAVRVIEDPLDADDFEDGSILVTSFTDPSWMHLMRRCAALVTDHGGSTSHAAIVARELGLLAVLGCQDATGVLAGVPTATVWCRGNGTGEVRTAAAAGPGSLS